MYKTSLKLISFALLLSFFNCKKNAETFSNFKFATEENVLDCDNLDTKLYIEALLTFENDIINTFDAKNKNLRTSYSFFTKEALGDKVNYQDLVSPHTMEVFEALKNDKDLWNPDNSINYNSEIMTCVSHNFKVKDLQSTFNALVSTNSMRSDIFGELLLRHVKNSNQDRYMASYIALDLFYTNLFEVDPTQITDKPKTETETNEVFKSNSSSIFDKKTD